MTEFFPQVRKAVQCLMVLIPSNEPCMAQLQIVMCKLPWSPSTNTYHRLEGQKQSPQYMLLKITLGHLTGTQSIMRHHESGRSSRKTEGMKLLPGCFCLPLPSFPFPYAGLHPTGEPAWFCRISDGVQHYQGGQGHTFFSIFCNTAKWMCQIS